LRVQVLSDLHLEFGEPAQRPADVDVIALAGDIDLGTDGVRWASEWAQGRPVLYVAGNHEFYGHSLPGLIDELREAARGTCVHLLENDELVLDGVRFLGCTLWSDFEFDGAARVAESMALCERVMRDYHLIRGADGERITPADTRALHLHSRRWLADRLAQAHSGQTVVITHHSPLVLGRPDSRNLRAIAGAFTSDLSELIGSDREALWIFGHTHRAIDLARGGTRVLSNPRGYPQEPVGAFHPALVVELDTQPAPDARTITTVEER
jgi:predicted phosphodiesterase